MEKASPAHSNGSRMPMAVFGPNASTHSGVTGITRGKKLVVLIGQRKALAMAVKNNRTGNRFSGLLARLIA